MSKSSTRFTRTVLLTLVLSFRRQKGWLAAARMESAANAMDGSGAVDQMKRSLLLDQLNSSRERRCFSRFTD